MCTGQCLDLQADAANCGACARVCGQGQVCNHGTCAVLPDDCTSQGQGCGAGYFCDPVSKKCMTGCRLPTDCPQGATCTAGSCACATGQHACGQRCVADDAPASCGTRCSACLEPVHAAATCAAATCGFTCTTGYLANAGQCVDVDECATANGGCSANATCTNTPGSRTCTCNAGYTGDGSTCVDVNECATNNGGCDVNAACANTPGARTCTCNTGFSGSGLTCADVNECLTANGGCDVHAACTNTSGSRTCACGTGYTGNGLTCTDVNECLTGNGGCDANATCTNTPGTRTCACNTGFTGSGLACADVDECLTGNGGCDVHATCTNTSGSRNCACISGYTGNGLTCSNGVVDSGIPELEIAQARTNAQQALTTPVDVSAATVTYLKPLIGSEAAGFFVQAAAPGPAIYVAVDPNTLTPTPQVGDRVAFTATAYALIGGLSEITGISNWRRSSSGNPVSSFTQNLTTSTTVAAAVDTLESELISMRGVLDGGFSSAGNPYAGAFLGTVASPMDNVRFRTPQTVVDTLQLERGCEITTGPTPLWRFNAQPQPMAWLASEVVVHSCPAPTVVNAVGTAPTTVVVSFSRLLLGSSVQANGSQFTFDNGLTASSAVVNGKQVTLTTASQGAGTAYLVTVASSLSDTRGSALGTPNTAAFTGAGISACSPTVVISAVFGGNSTTAPFNQDFIELHNRAAFAVSLNGWSIQYTSSTGITWAVNALTGTIAAGGYHLVGLSATAGGTAIPTPDSAPAGPSNLSGTTGKIALVNSTTPLTGNCPTANASVMDFFGYGSADCFEGTVHPALSSTTATTRNGLACTDTNVNATDFTAATATAPKNSASATNTCTCL